jgi:hypothetical protein
VVRTFLSLLTGAAAAGAAILPSTAQAIGAQPKSALEHALGLATQGTEER